MTREETKSCERFFWQLRQYASATQEELTRVNQYGYYSILKKSEMLDALKKWNAEISHFIRQHDTPEPTEA